MAVTAQDAAFMGRALQLARRARYSARPNPHVGCVLVRDGVVLGEGSTQPAGSAHAEIMALRVAGDAAGVTAYVSLEPCSHQGRTGPCADALVAAGVSRVVAAIEDPNPAVAGQGLARLRAAGVAVECGLMQASAAAEIQGFIWRMQRGYGRVRLKLAQSLDGRTAMASGESQWITGPAARRDVQRLRAASDVVLTGIGTVLADDCALQVREPQAVAAGLPLLQPQRMVLDSGLRTPSAAQVLRGGGATVLCHRQGQPVPGPLRDTGADFAALPDTGQGLDLAAVLQLCGQRQYNEILIESGPRLAGAWLQQGLVDELVLYQAPALLGSSGRPLAEMPLQSLADKVDLTPVEVRKLGSDWRLLMRPVKDAMSSSTH